MENGDLTNECLPHLEADPRWRLVGQIVSSPRFGRAAQLRNFLSYVARRRLENNAVEISEQEIGIHVFHRRANFNPNEDNIVRVQARHLRKKLGEYFADEGQEQPLVVTIPKGSYLPEFRPRIRTEAGNKPIGSPGNARLRVPLLTLGLVGFAILAALLWKRNIDLERQSHQAALRSHPLWTRVFTNRQKTNVVLGDANLVLLEDFVRSDITLEQYLSREYPENLLSTVNAAPIRPILKLMSSWRNSWFGDFGLASAVMEQGRSYSGRAVLRFPNGLNVGEFKTDNFVLIGSGRSIPWIRLFDGRLRYAVEYDPRSEQWIPDKRPHSGPAGYRVLRDQNGIRETFATVALVPNLARSGSVLILQGLTTAAAEGSLELLTSPDFGATLKRIEACKAVDLRSGYFELLFRTKPMASAPLATEVLACHALESAAE